MKSQLKFFDPSQPQTLQIVTMLFYFTAALDLFFLLFGDFQPVVLILDLIGALCAYGIANEKRIGYFGAMGIAGLKLGYLLLLVVIGGIGILLTLNGIIALMFDVAFLALLVHPQSREYQKIWFR